MDNKQSQMAAFMAGLSSKIILPLNEDALTSGSGAPSFYCVHSIAGFGGSDFTELAKEMGGCVRFFAIQAPKKLMMNSEITQSLKSVASHYADAIIKFQPDGEINLGGWSAGALVALEVAQQLKAKGREVGVLVSIDGAPKKSQIARAPLKYAAKVLLNLPAAILNDDLGRLRRQLLFKLANFRPDEKSRSESDIAHHPVQGFIKNFSQYPAYQQSFMTRLYDAIERSSFSSYDGDVVVYKARIEPIPLSGVEEFWNAISPDCEIVAVPGTHLNLVHLPNVRPIAADLKRRLTGEMPRVCRRQLATAQLSRP